MTVGNEPARELLGRIINQLRALRGHTGMPEQLLETHFDKAVNLLSEVEAAMGSAAMPKALVADKMNFSNDVIAMIKNVNSAEVNRASRSRIGLYLEICLQLFPKAAIQAKQKFNVDAEAIIEEIDKILRVSESYAGAYRANTTNFCVSSIRLINLSELQKVAFEAIEQVIAAPNAMAAYQHAYNELKNARERVVQKIGLGDRSLVYSIFMDVFLRGHIPVPIIPEEMLAYAMIANAVSKYYLASVG